MQVYLLDHYMGEHHNMMGSSSIDHLSIDVVGFEFDSHLAPRFCCLVPYSVLQINAW